MPNIILDMDVTELTTTKTLQRAKCVVVAVVPRQDSVQTQITISSTQLETRVPLTSLQMTATDSDTSTFTAQELCCACGGGFMAVNTIQEPSTTFICTTPLQTTTMRRVLSTLKSQQHVECTFCDPHLSSSSPTLTLSPILERYRYDTLVFNSSKQCCACGGGEHNLLIDANVSNSEGYTCSDIAVFRRYGYEDLCTSAYDTPAFVASEMCLVCGGGQLMEDSWYDTPEVQDSRGSRVSSGNWM